MAGKANKTPNRLSLFQYAFLALPLAFAGLPLYIHAPDFYIRDLGMNIGLLGTILLAIRLFDAFQDPVIGYFSDKNANQRSLIMTLGFTLLTLGMGAVFYGPQFGISIAIWFALSMILATTGFSILTINLNMMGGFWVNDKDQRTRIAGWREAFALVGLLIASILPPTLQLYYEPAQSFQFLFWSFFGLIILAYFLFKKFMSDFDSNQKSQKSEKAFFNFQFLLILFGRHRLFFFVCALSHFASAIPGVLVLFFIRDYLGTDDLTGLFLLLYFISGAIFMGLWVILARKIGKESAWLSGMILAVFTFIGAYFLQPGDIIGYAIICVLSGTALGADLSIPPSLLADKVSSDKKEQEASQYYAVLAFIPKVCIALASGISFLILDKIGFVAGQDNTDHALSGLIMLYALIPCLIKIFAAFVLWRSMQSEKKKDMSYATRKF
jgi:Na+/melibiose symporter-like transporter